MQTDSEDHHVKQKSVDAYEIEIQGTQNVLPQKILWGSCMVTRYNNGCSHFGLEANLAKFGQFPSNLILKNIFSLSDSFYHHLKLLLLLVSEKD